MKTPMQNFCVILTAFLWSAMLVLPLTGLAQTTNQVLSLDGSGDYVAVPSTPDLQNADQITLEAWIRPFAGSGKQTFISKSDGAFVNTSRSYEVVWFENGGNTGPGNRVEASLFVGTNNWVLLGAPAPADQWLQVTVTYQSGSGISRLYTNGVLAASSTTDASGMTQVAGQTIRQTSLPLYFGKLGHPVTFNFANGQMDEVRIWNKARTQAEIAGTMFSRLSGSEPNLVAYWTFDDGTARDVTGHGHDGVFANNARTIPMALPTPRPSLTIKVASVVVTMNLVEGRKYLLESSSDLSTWQQVEDAFVAQTNEINATFSVSQTGQFFKISEAP